MTHRCIRQLKVKSLIKKFMYFTFLRLVVLICIVSASLSSQTRFLWPDSIEDVTQYTRADECWAATLRLIDSASDRDSILKDTILDSPSDLLEGYDSRIVKVANDCIAKWNSESANLEEFPLFLRLFLVAGRATDVHSLIERKLQETPYGSTAKGDTLHRKLLETILLEWNRYSRPLDIETLARYAHQYVDVQTEDTKASIRGLYSLVRAAFEVGNHQVAKEAYLRISKIIAEAEDTERDQIGFSILAEVFNSGILLEESGLLDSLKKGTDKYLAAFKKNIEDLGLAYSPHYLPVGWEAPPIVADAWISCIQNKPTISCSGESQLEHENMLRPVKGKANLIVFINAASTHLALFNKANFYRFVLLRHLSQQYPDLEITVVQSTNGNFGKLGPLAPEDEAQIFAKELFHDFKVPAVLGVHYTDFWRLDPPDNRRINRDNPNVDSYKFNVDWSPVTASGGGGYFLADRSGIIVATGVMTRDSYNNSYPLPKLIESLLEQESK